MMYTAHPIDISLFVVFLVINLVVGLRYGRSIKTFRDYVLGGRNFSTATLAATIVATCVTGRYLTVWIDNIYQNGIFFVIVYLCGGGSLLLIGWLFAMRMGPFLKSTSVAEAMGHMYGKYVRTITAILGLSASVSLTSLQFSSGKSLFMSLFGWDSVYSTLITGGIIIIYATSGGIRSVTFTDIFQFLTFGTLLPVLALAIWHHLDDFSVVRDMIQHTPHWNIKEFLKAPESVIKWPFLTLVPLYSLPSFVPANFQRAIMAKNVYQMRKAFLYSALLYFLIVILIIWITLLLRAQNPNLDYGSLFQYIVDHYASSIGLRGLFLSGFMAMVMSTADSNLNVAASMLVNDLIVPLANASTHPVLKRLSTDRVRLTMARVSTVVLGLLALLLSFNLIEYSRLSITSVSTFQQMRWVLPFVLPWHFYMPVVSIPLLLDILGFRSTTRTVLMGMAMSLLTVYLWIYLLPHTTIDSIVPGILANLIVLMGSHYLFKTPGGWQALEPGSPLALERASRQQAWRRRWYALRNFTLYPYLKKNLPTQEGLYFLIGLYILITTYVAFYTVKNVENTVHFKIYQSLYYVVLLVSTAFLTFPVWSRPVQNLRFWAYLWPIGIGVTLFFTGALLVILSEFHPVQVTIIAINFLTVILLFRWPLALLLAFIKITLAVFFCKQYASVVLPMNVSDLLGFRTFYGLLIFASFVVAFLKGKQVYRELVASHAKLHTDQNFVSQFLFAMFQQNAAVFQEAQAHPFKKPKNITATWHANLSKEQLSEENEALHHQVYQLETYNRHLKQVFHRTQHPMPLVVESAAIRGFWQEALEAAYQYKGIHPVVAQYDTTCEILQADLTKIQRLLSNALTYTASLEQDESTVLLGFEDTQLAYPVMALPGYVKYVKAVRMTITTTHALPKLKKWYLGSVDYVEIVWPQDMAALPVTYNQQIVEAHYGFVEMTRQPAGLTLVYVIPWDVREVRPSIMDQVQPPTTSDRLEETPTSSSEDAFVSAVHAKTAIDAKFLKQAIHLLKQYYGEKKYNTTDEPYYTRAIAVAQIVLECTADPNTILAALMHDIIDHTHCSLQQIALYCNPVVQRLVDGVARVESRLQSSKKLQLSRLENRRKLLEAKDERILHIALAVRLHALRKHRVDACFAQQKEMAQEILHFFVPVATKLGLKFIAKELKERCLVVLRKETST